MSGAIRRIRAIFCAAAVLSPLPAAAQIPADTPVIPLDTLQVPVIRTTAGTARAPMSLSRIGRDRIQEGRATIGLDEALASVPGLIVDNRQNFSLGSRIVVRGLGARAAFGVRGLRVMVDGIPLTMPDGQTNLNNLDLGSAGSIHVLRGPASALFGNAAGGVIAIETEPAPGPRSAEGRVIIGDQGRSSLTRMRKVQAKVAETIGEFDYHASVSRLEADGYRDHSRARQTLVNARAGYNAGAATRLTLVVNAVDVPVAENPGALPFDSAQRTPSMAWARNVATGTGESTRQAQAGLRLQHTGRAARTDASVHILQRSLDNPLPFGVIDLERTAAGARALHERTLGGIAVTAGLDVEAQRDSRREFANENGRPIGTARRDQEDRVAGIGPFAQVRADVGRAGFTLGGRYDAVRFETLDLRGTVPDESGRRTLHAPSVMLGATYALPGGTVFANLATAFQTPTTTELLNSPPAPGQPCCPTGFNTELEPQRMLSAEAGVRGSLAPRWTYEAAAYHMDVHDALVQFQVPEADGRDFFRNAGRTRHRGIELGTNAALSRTVSLAAAYALTDVRFRDDGSADTQFEGNRVPGIAPHRFFATLTWSPGRSAFTAEMQHNSRQFANDANTAANDAWSLLDLRAHSGFTVGTVEIGPFIALNNVLNRKYAGSLTVNAAIERYFETAPPFNVVLGASIRTGGWRRR